MRFKWLNAQVETYRSNMEAYLRKDIGWLERHIPLCPPSYVDYYRKQLRNGKEQLERRISQKEHAAEKRRKTASVRIPAGTQLRGSAPEVYAFVETKD